MQLPPHLQDVSSAELSSPLVAYLMQVILDQKEEISNLKSEIRLLKGHSAQPTIRPTSRLEVNQGQQEEVKKNSFYKTS